MSVTSESGTNGPIFCKTIRRIGRLVVVLLCLIFFSRCGCEDEGGQGGNRSESEFPAGTGFINGLVVDAGNNQPLQDVNISVKGAVASVLSDRDGKFSLPVVPKEGSEIFSVTVKKEGYTSAYRNALVASQRDATIEEVRLTPADSAVTKIGPSGGSHTNSTGTIQLEIPPGAIDREIEVRATQYTRGKDLGGVLPSTSFFTYAADFSPDDVKFSKPVDVRVKNTRGFKPGTKVPLGFFNKETMKWEDTGMGEIDSTGEWLVLKVDHFSPYDFNFPVTVPPGSKPPEKVANETRKADGFGTQQCGNSAVELATGDLTIDRTLPSYRIFGQDRALRLVYQSDTVNPSALLRLESDLGKSSGDLPPKEIGFKATFEGRVEERRFEAGDKRGLFKVLFPGTDLRGQPFKTGLYHYDLELTKYYEANYATAECFGCLPKVDLGVKADELKGLAGKQGGEIPIINQSDSPFGAGWGLAGVKRIYKGGRELLVVDGEGLAIPFSSNSSSEEYQIEPVKIPLQPIESLAIDSAGNLFYANDSGGSPYCFVYKIDLKGNQSRIAVIEDCWAPSGLAVDANGNIFLSNIGNPFAKKGVDIEGGIRKISPDGKIVWIVGGRGESGYSGDGGPALEAKIHSPREVAVDREGSLYFADSSNFVVRKIDPAGKITTVAGNGSSNHTGDRGPATAAAIGLPLAVALDNAGNLFIAGLGSFVRKVNVQGVISTVAGTGMRGFSGDGRQATEAEIWDYIAGIDVDGDGNIYITDGYRIRKIDARGIITTIGGNGDYASFSSEDQKEGIATEVAIGDVKSVVVHRPSGKIYTNELHHLWALTRLLDKNAGSSLASRGPFTSVAKLKEGGYRLTSKNQEVDEFDANGFLKRHLDRAGQATIYTYDKDRLVKIVDSLGGETRFEYDATNHVSSITDPQGRKTKITVDGKGNLVEVVLPNSASWRYDYDEKHLLVQKKDPRGHPTKYAYDEYGKIKEIVAPTGEVRKYETSLAFGLINKMPAGLDKKLPIVPASDQVTKYTDGLGRVTTSTFDGQGGETRVTDPEGNTTLFERNRSSQPTKVTLPTGASLSYRYNGRGDLLETGQDNFSIGLRFKYDKNSRLIQYQRKDNQKEILEYDDKGNLVALHEEGGEFFSPRKTLFRWTFNEKGFPVTEKNIRDETTFYSYDSKGNLEAVTDPLGRKTTLGYDAVGNLASVTDGNGHVTRFTYDELNRMTSVTDPDGKKTTFSYTSIGCGCGGTEDRVTQVTDPIGRVTSFQYDALGQLTTVIDPLGNKETREYDLARNLVKKTDRNGGVITWQYDKNDRLVAVKSPEGTSAFSYDPLDNLTSASDPNSSLKMTWKTDKEASGTPLNTLTGLTMGGSLLLPTTLNYRLKYNMILRERKDSVATVVWKLTDTIVPQVYEVTDNRDYHSIGFVRDPLERIKEVNFISSIADTLVFQYSSAGELGEIGIGKVDKINYTYDKSGNRVSMKDSAGENLFSYDPLDRLLTAKLTGESYGYDAVGNRLKDASKSYSHNTNNQMTSVSGDSYSYDKNGNLTSKTVGGVSWTYSWNSKNQLVKATNSTGLNASFVYDPLGRRIQKTVNGVTRKYIYDGAQIWLEYDGANKLLASYLYGPGIDQPLVKRDETTGKRYFYYADALGSIRYITDEEGKVVNSYRYDSFGNILSSTEGVENPYTFTGREYEPALGLYYYRARWYDPKAGRFISEDPIGFGGGDLNWYAYVGNNPVNGRDPDGLLAAPWHFVITYDAAWNAGYSAADSFTLAWNATAVDFKSGSQGTNPEATVQHGMGHGRQGRDDAIAATNSYIQESINNGNLGGAIHAAQDLATPGHAGHPWQGFHFDWETAGHVFRDIFPSFDTFYRAYQNTGRVLRCSK